MWKVWTIMKELNHCQQGRSLVALKLRRGNSAKIQRNRAFGSKPTANQLPKHYLTIFWLWENVSNFIMTFPIKCLFSGSEEELFESPPYRSEDVVDEAADQLEWTESPLFASDTVLGKWTGTYYRPTWPRHHIHHSWWISQRFQISELLMWNENMELYFLAKRWFSISWHLFLFILHYWNLF